MLKNEGKVCSVDGCSKPAKTRLLCSGHYQAAHARGEFQKFTPEDRFWAKVDKRGGLPDFTDPLVRVTETEGECWLWTGSTHGRPGRYGSFWDGERVVNAHRASLTWSEGGTTHRPEDADHLCRRSLCVRPSHLEWVSRSESVLRGRVGVIRSVRRTSAELGWDAAVAALVDSPSKTASELLADNPYRRKGKE